MPPRLTRWLITAAVSIAILVALLSWLPFDAVANTLSRLSPSVFAAATFIFVLGHVASASKWWALLRACGTPVSWGRAVAAHGAGLFANLGLPTIVGGDIVRVGLVARHGGAWSSGVVGSLCDRLLDLFALCCIAGVGALAAAGDTDNTVLAGALALVGLGLLALVPVGRWIVIRLGDRLPARLQGVRTSLVNVSHELSSRRTLTVSLVAIAVGVQAAFVVANMLLGMSVGLEMPWWGWAFAWPAAKLIALVPISLGGLGVREAAFASLVLPLGADPAMAVAQSLSWQAVLVAGALVGALVALIVFARPFSPPATPEPGRMGNEARNETGE